MSLITPSFGLLFWMVVIFGLVFLILARFGFPVITRSIRRRSDYIEESLKAAEQARARIEGLVEEQKRVIEQTRLEQSRLLKESAEARDRMVEDARKKAEQEAAKIIAHAKTEIAAERESTIREIRSQIAAISVDVAEKVLGSELGRDEARLHLMDRLIDETAKVRLDS